MGFIRQQIQCQGFLKMVVDIATDLGALSVSGDSREFLSYGKSGIAHEADHQNFHKCLTDIFIAGAFLLHFPENVSQTTGDFRTFKMIQQAELSVGIFTGCQCDAFNPQHDIFQRLGIQTGFRVDHVGIDYHKIVHIHREGFIFDQKLSLAANNVNSSVWLWVWGMECQSPP